MRQGLAGKARQGAWALSAMLWPLPLAAEDLPLRLGLGGYVSAYAFHTTLDDASTGGVDRRRFDLRKESEIHLTGDTTLASGLKAGVHIEIQADRATDAGIDEGYLYLSGDWGRINIGEEDEVGYLLQVTPPLADDKLDGARPDLNTFANALVPGAITYAQDATADANKVSYMTPVLGGFQAGISFTPSSIGNGDLDALSPAAGGADSDQFENGVSLAARFEHSFDEVRVTLGAGYTRMDQEAGGPFNSVYGTDWNTWNAGGVVGFGPVDIGASYYSSDNGLSGAGYSDIAVAGINYSASATVYGASYTDVSHGPALTGAGRQDIARQALGVIHEWAPGMTLRGSAMRQATDNADGAGGQARDLQFALGTQIDF